MKIVFAVVAAMSLMAGSAMAQGVGPILASVDVDWTMPDTHEDWEPWMAGATIQIKAMFHGPGGAMGPFLGVATIDYETVYIPGSVNGGEVEDPDDVPWIIEAWVPQQIITAGVGKVAVVESSRPWDIFRGGPFEHKKLNLGFLKINGTYPTIP